MLLIQLTNRDPLTLKLLKLFVTISGQFRGLPQIQDKSGETKNLHIYNEYATPVKVGR